MESKITEQYKKEVSDILSKIGEGLSDKVTAAIEPKIQNISLNVTSQSELVKNIKNENEKSSKELKKRVENFETIFRKYKITTENLEKSLEKRNIEIGSSIDKNSQILSQLKKTYAEDWLSEIRKISNNEELKLIKTEVTQLQAKLQTTEKLMYTTLVFLFVLSSLIVFLIYK